MILYKIYPSLTLPLQRGGNKISGLPPLQGGIKGGKSDLCVHDSPCKGEGTRFLVFPLCKIGLTLLVILEARKLWREQVIESGGL